MVAGVPQYAVYLIHRLYDRTMALPNLQSLAAYLITETASQDPKVGGPVKMALITPTEGYREIARGTVDAIVQRNEGVTQKVKEFFRGGNA